MMIRLVITILIGSLIMTGCQEAEVSNSVYDDGIMTNDGTDASIHINELGTDASTETSSNERTYYIEDYDNVSWHNNEDFAKAIIHIFQLKERYYNHEFNYGVLIEGLSPYFDLPKTFIEPGETYGVMNLDDAKTIVSNGDTAELNEDEFADLLDQLIFKARPYDIQQIFGLGPVTESIQSTNRRYYMSSIIEEDDNSIIIYMKVLKHYDETAMESFDFDTGITDYWFLYNKDIGKIYSHRNWPTVGDSDSLDYTKVTSGNKVIELELYDVTDSIIGGLND